MHTTTQNAGTLICPIVRLKDIPMVLLPNIKPFLAAMIRRRPKLLKTMAPSTMVFVAVLAMTGGCAYSYVDQHGIHHRSA